MSGGETHYSRDLPIAQRPFKVLTRAWVLCAIVFVLAGTVDLAARFLGGSPALQAVELTRIFGAFVLMLTLALMIHYREMMLYLLLSDRELLRGHRVVDAVADGAGAILFMIISVRLSSYTAEALVMGRTTAQLGLPEALVAFVMALVAGFAGYGCAVAALSVLLRRKGRSRPRTLGSVPAVRRR
ncbi:MAG: TRAP transporter small permease subunit [Pseudomonadota bacterium]